MRFRTALGVVGEFTTSEMIFFPMSNLWFEWAVPFGNPTFQMAALPSHQTHTLLFRRGMLQMGCVASAQLQVCRAACKQHRVQALRAAAGSAGLYSVLWLRIQRQKRYPPSIPPFGSGLLNPINHNHFVTAQRWKYWQVEVVEEFAKCVQDTTL